MTILGYFFPEQTPWMPFYDINREWGRRRMMSPWFDRWREAGLNSPKSFTRERQIPIQIQEPDYLDYWQEWSDSDSDDYDLNTNSNYKPPRKKRFCPSATRNSSSDSESISAERIDLHNDRSVTRRKVSFREASSTYRDSHDLARSPTYTTRSSEKEHSDRPNYVIYDSDTENDINETCSYSVYKYLKTFLNSIGRQIDAIKGDGNCFFRALSKVIYGNQSYYSEVREAVVDVLIEHPRKFEAFTDGSMSDHIKSMHQDKTWATQTEIYAAATLLSRDIYILSPDQTGKNYRWLLFKPQLNYYSDVTGCKCYVTICHTHGNHYDRITGRNGKCNCDLPVPEMSGINESIDLTNEIV